jgi:hypothetical protein
VLRKKAGRKTFDDWYKQKLFSSAQFSILALSEEVSTNFAMQQLNLSRLARLSNIKPC